MRGINARGVIANMTNQKVSADLSVLNFHREPMGAVIFSASLRPWIEFAVSVFVFLTSPNPASIRPVFINMLPKLFHDRLLTLMTGVV